LKPKIIRKEFGNCCDWCKEVVGVYTYPDVPDGVYKRHRYCKCRVIFEPGDGRRQDVHTKRWIDFDKNGKIEKRKENTNKKLVSVDSKQFGKKASKHMSDYGLDVSNENDREKFQEIIFNIVDNSDYRVYGVDWRGQSDPVIAYVKGKDAVLVNKNNEFITIMKGGAENARIKNKGK